MNGRKEGLWAPYRLVDGLPGDFGDDTPRLPDKTTNLLRPSPLVKVVVKFNDIRLQLRSKGGEILLRLRGVILPPGIK